MPERPRIIMRSLANRVWQAARVVGVMYLLILLLMLNFENDLIYPAPPASRGNWDPAGLAYEDVYFTAADGTRLHGWYVEHAAPRAEVVYFHGNATHLPDLAAKLRALSETQRVSILAFDYRGYGRSEGTPHEAGVLADGDAAIRWLAERTGRETSQFVLHGRSLGGAVAIDMAARHGACGLILEDTFTSMPDVAAPLYPWIPVRMLMRTQYNSVDKIRDFEGLLLQGHGTADRLVPLALAQRLHAAAERADRQFLEMPGKDHDHSPTPAFGRAITEFYDRLAAER